MEGEDGAGGVDDEQRLAAVRRYDVLDTPPDGAFDRVTAIAARTCGVPISTISVVDHDRIWFRSVYGIDVQEIPREPGLCASAVIDHDPYIVEDAAIDPRTLDNSLVRGALGLRFYVGIPLRTSDGHNLGTLNVIDREPRRITQPELDTLQDLAAIVVDELDLRLAARRTVELEAVREAERFRDTILSGISHEMRTPLAVLHGIAGLEPVDLAEERVRHAMRRHVGHLDWLVNQFVEFTRIEKGEVPAVEPRPLALAELVSEVTELFTDRAPLEVRVDGAAPTAVADRDRTRQILIELVNNAVRFSPDDTTVRIEVGPGDDGTVAVAVTDQGPGIEPADHERVFHKFHRSTTSSGGGIGLYVSRALAESQGGRIVLESSRGQGARFTLLLPVETSTAAG